MSIFRLKGPQNTLKDFVRACHLCEPQNSVNSAKESLGLGSCVRNSTAWGGGRRYRTTMNYIAVVSVSGIVFSNAAFAHVEPKFLELNSVSVEKILHFRPEFVPLRNFLVSDTGLDRREYGTNESKKGFGHGISNVIALIVGMFIGCGLVIRSWYL